MSGMEIRQTGDVSRTSSLVAYATGKMAVTYVFGTICASAVTIVDSLIAGVSIGQEALAAIAAAAPLLTMDQILHCVLGIGIDKLMIRAIGEGDRKKANRIFGTILITVPISYALVFGLLGLIERPLLQAITGHTELVDMVVPYTVPLFISAPFFETFLCIERAFRIDGRARFFSKRSIVTNVANVVCDILMVTVFNLGISGLAWASVISTTIGYTITLSHFFSKKRTVAPDFSVILSRKEMFDILKQNVRLGSSATLDEVMGSVALSTQTFAIGAIGGARGLAIWTVYQSLRGVIVSVSNGISSSVSVHAGLLYGQEDYEGVRYSVRSGVQLGLLASLAVMLIVLIFIHPIVEAYGIDPDIQWLCSRCIRIGCLAFPPIVFLNIITIYLPSVNKFRLASNLVLLEHGLAIAAASSGLIMDSQAFFIAYVGAELITSLIAVILLKRNKNWFVPERNTEGIVAYSIRLEPHKIVAVSDDINRQMANQAYSPSFCSRVSLALEDSMNYIAYNNAEAEIDVDVDIKRHETGVQILIMDSGLPYNPLVDTTTRDLSKVGELESVIILGLSETVSYDRVLDLNRMSLFLIPSAS